MIHDDEFQQSARTRVIDLIGTVVLTPVVLTKMAYERLRHR